MIRTLLRGSVIPAVLVAAGALLGAAPAAAEAPDGSSVTGTWPVDGRTVQLRVHSAAMNTDIMVNVQRPADTGAPAPVLYLLNGGGGGQDTATWQRNTDVLGFLSDKQVYVVQPVGGKWSYYTDWRAPDPKLGVYKWKTFLTEELPPLIDAEFATTGANAVAGLSTSGTSVLQLPIAEPGLYRAVAAYSGCAQISDPLGRQFVKMSVESWGGGDTVNMYGPDDDPMWAANDPYLHADGLRGLAMFISHSWGYWQDALKRSWPVLASGLGVPV